MRIQRKIDEEVKSAFEKVGLTTDGDRIGETETRKYKKPPLASESDESISSHNLSEESEFKRKQ